MSYPQSLSSFIHWKDFFRLYNLSVASAKDHHRTVADIHQRTVNVAFLFKEGKRYKTGDGMLTCLTPAMVKLPEAIIEYSFNHIGEMRLK